MLIFTDEERLDWLDEHWPVIEELELDLDVINLREAIDDAIAGEH